MNTACNALSWRKYWAPAASWTLTALIFAIDIAVRSERVSVYIAYLLPVFLSSYAVRPRPFIYAGAATGLALVGAAPLVVSGAFDFPEVANKLIAMSAIWLGALLVDVQSRRRDELRLDVERQQRFVDILSHEIRNALTAVGGHAQRLSKLSTKLTPADIATRAEKIRDAAARIEAIISRVQFASSLGNGMVPMSRDCVDVNALIRDLTERLKEEHEGRLIDTDLTKEEVRIGGDEVLLRHAIENIILNSLLYSPVGSRVHVRTARTGAGARVTVTDRGAGIAPDDLPRIREPYFRGGVSKGKPGTGLGLYFADRIVRGHKGAFQIESAVGEGTTVTIEVPMHAGAA